MPREVIDLLWMEECMQPGPRLTVMTWQLDAYSRVPNDDGLVKGRSCEHQCIW
jgi:hypothetical protein